MKNLDIRIAASNANLKLWQVAEAMGISDSYFSRKLRHELPEADKEYILSIIEQTKRRMLGGE